MDQQQSQPASNALPNDAGGQPTKEMHDVTPSQTEPKNKNKKVLIITLIIWFLVAGAAGAAYFYWEEISEFIPFVNKQDQPQPVACTEEAKVCPDGSSVGRIPPDCEFAECPEVKCVEEGEYVDHPSKDSFECCEDLVKESALPVDENCQPIIPEGSPGIEPGWTCINCGDGICKGDYENKCNCPEDCEEESLQSEVSAEDWQTYQNEEYEYEIEYPKELDLSFSSDENSLQTVKINEKEDTSIIYMSLLVIDNQDDLSIDQYIESQQVEPDAENMGQSVEVINQEDYQSGDIEGKKVIIKTNLRGYSDEYEEIVLKNKNYFYLILPSRETTTNLTNEQKETANNIISTFKFIDQDSLQSGASAEDWQTYRNEEWGFEVQYDDSEVIIINDEYQDFNSIKLWYKPTYEALIAETIPEGLPAIMLYKYYKPPENITEEWIKSKGFIKEESTELFAGLSAIVASGDEILSGSKLYILYPDDEPLFIDVVEWQLDTYNFNKVFLTFKFIQDSDNDGLFDDEETQYGTDINNPDSDGDGYQDGDEVDAGYDPMGEGKL